MHLAQSLSRALNLCPCRGLRAALAASIIQYSAKTCGITWATLRGSLKGKWNQLGCWAAVVLLRVCSVSFGFLAVVRVLRAAMRGLLVVSLAGTVFKHGAECEAFQPP